MNSQADLDKKLVEIGVEFTEERFTGVYGLKPGEFRLRQSAPAVPTTGTGANFSAPSDQSLAEKAQANLDEAIKKMLPDALKASSGFVTEVENAIRTADSFDDLQDSLVELLAPSMTPGELETFLARAMTAAAGHGAASVNTETDEDA